MKLLIKILIIFFYLIFFGQFVFSDVSKKDNPFRKSTPREIIEASEKNDHNALCLLGDLYAKGHGVPKNIMKSIECYEKAASLNNPEACLWLANSYIIDRNYNEAYKWFLKSAKQNNIIAQYTLGEIYEEGRIKFQNYDKAFKWYKKSAEGGYVAAQYKLGKFYFEAKGINKNYDFALFWLKQSLTKSHTNFQSDAEFLIGKVYEIKKMDQKKVFKWYEKSALKGNPKAQFEMAKYYVTRSLTSDNMINAYSWLILASKQDYKEADLLKRDLRKQMKSYQIQRAQEKSSLFKKYKPKANESGVSTGTGFFISHDGFILTAYHVVQNAKRIEIKSKEDIKVAIQIKKDEANDLALLKINGKYNYINIINSKNTKLGDQVFTVGFPNISIQGMKPKYTKGEISSLSGVEDNPFNFQISIPVQPGNSGGPLVNSKGNVIGVIISILAQQRTWQLTGSIPQNVGYAVKSDIILDFLTQHIDFNNQTVPITNPIQNTEDAVLIVFAYKKD